MKYTLFILLIAIIPAQRKVYKVNKLCFVKDYVTKYKTDSLPEYIYMDVEMIGPGYIDLDDLTAVITEKGGKQIKSWAFDFFYLNKDGKKVKEDNSNNKPKYSHIGIVFPATAKSQKIQLHYWGGPLCDTIWNITQKKVKAPWLK